MKFPQRAPFATTLVTVLCAVILCLTTWQGLGFTLGWAFQQPPVISGRTLVTTIAGGGFSAIAPPKEAPLVSPAMTARDPQGRGFYVVDEVNGTSLLKFVNTSNAAVTLGGVTIPAGQIGLVAGGGAAPDNGSAREVDLSLITGICVDPNGNALYFTAPLVNAVRAVNVGTQPLQLMNQTVAAGNVGNLFLISRPELRALAVHPTTRDFYYVSTLSDSSTIKVVYRRDAASGQESVYAGGGEPPIGNGDDGVATSARIVTPIGLAFDRNNLLLIAEGGDARRNPGAIRRVESGSITSLIKNLDFPTGLSVAANGDVYVAIGNKQQIGRVSTTGVLTVVAGNNSATACNATGAGTCGDGGAALSALLNLPSSTDQRTFDFAVDANGVIIPGLSARRVRYASFSNSTVTVAGTFIEPRQINSIAGNGQEAPYDNIPATSSELQTPVGVVADPNGNLFIADSAPDPVSRLRFVNRGATPVTLFANTAWAKTVQPGHIVTLNDQVGEPLADERITTASFQWPQGMFATTKGLYIIDSQYGALIKPQGSLSGRRSGHLRFLNTSITDVVLFPAGGNFKITVPPGEIRDIAGVNQVNPNTNYGLNGNIGDGGQSVGAVLFPTDVVVSPGGSIFIADQGSNRIRVIDAFTGIIRSLETATISGDRLPLTTNGATGLAFDSRGRLVIADTKLNQILRQSGPNSTTFTVIANAALGINRPRDVVVDAADNIFVSNSGNHQVLRVVAPSDALGTVTTVAGTGVRGFAGDGGTGLRAKFDLPNPASPLDVQLTVSLAFLPGTGELVVADANNNRIRLLTPVPNQPPVITAPPDTTLNENETRTLNFSVTDGNNDPLSISITNRPPFVTFTDTGNGTGRLNLAPTFTDAGTYTLTISANDGDATETKDFSIIVNNVNRPPTASAAAISSTLEATSATGRQITLGGAGSDPDNDSLTFKWFDGAALIAQTATPTVTLAFGGHSLMMTVTDSKGLSASTTAQTVVVQDTTAPVFTNTPADLPVPSAVPATVNFMLPTATDAVDGIVIVTAQPPSGSVFPIGSTTVTFTAKDARNNTATTSFRVVLSSTGGGGGGGGGGGTGGGGTTATSFTITTYAGNGSYSFSGDGGAATEASFKDIRAIHRDSNGNVYVVDAASRNIRRINLQGQITGFAGNGINSNDGDSKQATTANFNTPSAVTSDAQGNVYIADAFYNRVRRVTTDGRIAHFAGLSSGVGGYGGDSGAAALARLNRPSGLAVFGSFIYIADTGNNRIRRVNLDTNVIETYAGDGITGQNGDGGLATTANLSNPVGVAFDAAGNLFIADRNNHRIRRVDVVTRIITSVAGTGQPGFTGDDGAAANAQLNAPNDVAVDALGNFYIADQANHRIRRITTNGVIKTVAGTGSFGFNGDNISATTAQLNAPNGLTVDPQGSVFITDAGNLRIRKLTANTTTSQNRIPAITSTLGNQTLVVGQILELPLNATDADNDNVTFTLINAPSFATITNAAQRSATLRLAPTATGTFNNVQVQASDGKGGTATSVAFNITVNEATGTNRPPTANANAIASPVEATSASGATISLSGQGSDPDGDALTYTWFNGATSIAAGANASVTLPIGSHSLKLTVSDGRGGVAMTAPQTVVVRDTTAPVFSNLPADITTPATSASGAAVNFTLPTASDAVDGAVAVTANRTSGSVFPVGATTVTFTAKDSRNNEATASFTITVGPSNTGGGSTPTSYTITTHAGTGEFGSGGDGGAATSANFRNLTSFNRDKDGNLRIADQAARVVRRIAADGSIRTIVGNGTNGNAGDNSLGTYASFGALSGVAADGLGNLYVSDSANHRVRRIGTDGKITHFAGSSAGQSGSTGDQSPPASARLNRPTALAVDAQNNLYILDSGNSRIRRVDIATNLITTYAGSGVNGFSGDGNSATGASLSYPSSIAFDGQGNLYIADRSNHRIRRVDSATKNISTVAGSGAQGFGGDDGEALNAALNNPTDVALDAAGNLFIVDQNNHRIRRVRASNRVIETIAGTGLQSFGGDNGPAAQGYLSAPTAVNVAADGSVYVGDTGNLRIRKLAPASGSGANRNPVITSALGNQSLIINQPVDVALAATDEDGDAVTFTLLNAPGFATITNANPAQRTSTLRLAPTQAGTFNGMQVRATDSKNGTATSATFNIVVSETGSGGNRAPVIQTIADQTVTRGQAIDVTLSATDADNDTVTFALDNAPSFVTLVQSNPTQRTALLRIAPPLEGGDATLNLRVRADDGHGGATTSNSFVVNVRSATGGGSGNRPPVAIANVLLAELVADTQGAAPLRLDGTASSDPDGDSLSYAWLDRGVAIATTGVAEIRLPVGEHLISLRVSDNRGGSTTTIAQSVKVIERPILPTLSIQSVTPGVAKRGSTVTVTIIGTGFQPGAQVQIAGGGVAETVFYVNANTLSVRLSIAPNAFTTTRTIYVTNPDSSYAVKPNAFVINP